MSRRRIGNKPPYPMIGAAFVPADELGFETEIEKRNVTNHHYAFTAKKMGKLLITQTFRDLDRNQVVLPRDEHTELHRIWGEPDIEALDLLDLMKVIDESYQMKEMLRYGSANNPHFRPISNGLMVQMGMEYGMQA